MKRSDLKVGEDYYDHSSDRWVEYGGGAKVTVVSLTRLSLGWFHYGDPPYRLTLDDGSTVDLPGNVQDDPKGQHVAVRYDNGEYGVVLTREIRGLWEDCKKREDEFREARNRRLSAEQERRDEVDTRWADQRARLERLGVEGLPTQVDWRGFDPNVRITLDQIEHLLAAVEAGKGEQP